MRYRVEELAHRYAGIIINQKLIDIPLKRAEERAQGITDYQSIDINSVTHKVEREVARIYQALNYSARPFWHVLPESGKPKKEVIDTG